MKINKIILYSLFSLIGIYSCSEFEPAPIEEDNILDGPIEGLSHEESRRFLNGDEAFNDLVFTTENGLGPIFVGTSCASCHAGDGKGHPFSTLIRFGQSDATGNHYLDQGGRELQNRAIPGYLPETLPAGAPFTKLTPPSVTGLGHLEFVTDADILAMADPNDADGDGISGRPNWYTAPDYVTLREGAIENNGMYIHRFGKKASIYNLLHQTVDALTQDIGITSIYDPIDIYSGEEIDPEIETTIVNDLAFYLKTLKAPIQRNQDDPEVQKGQQVFNQINCTACHKPELKTGPAPIEALANKTFHPYTDLLLHDMGPGLDDGYTEGTADSNEWRTAPLWGLGLSQNSQGGQVYLLHDGRARSIEEAVLLHGGEAQNAKNNYENLTAGDKAALIKFLESL